MLNTPFEGGSKKAISRLSKPDSKRAEPKRWNYKRTPTSEEIAKMEERRFIGTPPHQKIILDYKKGLEEKAELRDMIAVELKKILEMEKIPKITNYKPSKERQ